MAVLLSGRWLPLIIVTMLGLLLAGPGLTRADNLLIAGGEDGYEPYETLDENGEPVGFNIDLLRAIGREMGFEVRFELGPWEESRRKLATGEIETLGMFVSEPRREIVQFASPHVIVYHRIFRLAGDDPIRTLEDLAGNRVIVQRSAYSHEYLQQAGLDVELVLVDNDFDGLQLMAEGAHDAALLTEHRGRFALQRNQLQNLAVSGPPVLPVEYALAVRRGNDELLTLINQGLERVTASGEFDQIYQRWLQPYDSSSAPLARNGVLFAAIMLVMAMAAIAFWQMKRVTLARSEQRRAEQQIEYLRRNDALTGLYNRHKFEHLLETFLEQPDRKEGAHALMTINVDQFRVLNEHLGHARADHFLRNLASLLRQILPGNASIARLGSDEFIVLLPNTTIDKAETTAQKIIAEVNTEGMSEDAGSVKVGLSIGLVGFQGRDNSVAQLLRRADCACLAAKEDGGNRVHHWNADDRRLAERQGQLRWVAEIHSALEEDRILAYWQPIVVAGDDAGQVISVEMLVRMRDPDGNIIAAGQFMPAAERYFLSTRIDRWMVSWLLDWLESNPEVGECLETININLSGRSLGDPNFLDFLEERTLASGELCRSLCFEITETALISNLSMARSVLDRLHDSGCRFALDDFGIGLSSMGYLRNLPVDYLKIDGSFVRGIDRDPAALNMIKEINRLGHAMGKITVAEYVETPQIQALLVQTGVDRLQGYLFGAPEPLEVLLECCSAGSCRLPRSPETGENELR